MSPAGTHTSERLDSGSVTHYWEVRGPHGAVSLSALEHNPQAARMVGNLAANVPAAAAMLAGAFQYDVVQVHRDIPFGDSSCMRHEAAGCAVDAFSDQSIGLPMWRRVVDAGLTEAAVFAELESLHAVEFGEAAA